jgi:hypothetical protein
MMGSLFGRRARAKEGDIPETSTPLPPLPPPQVRGPPPPLPIDPAALAHQSRGGMARRAFAHQGTNEMAQEAERVALENKPPTVWQRLVSSCQCGRQGDAFMEKCICSKPWKVLLPFFTLLLLFGSQIQSLAVPKRGDIAFDVLYTLGLAFFLVDLCIRCRIEPNYFMFSICGRGIGDAPGSVVCGSFMFWCDLVSTLAFLYDISYVNTRHYDMITVDIALDPFGQPVSFAKVFLLLDSLILLLAAGATSEPVFSFTILIVLSLPPSHFVRFLVLISIHTIVFVRSSWNWIF